MMNKVLTTNKDVYESPSATIICLEQMMTVCESNGTTENYGSQSIWETGDDNE